MCGIAGYIGKGTTESLHAMADALHHRGPDDAGFYESGAVGFAFRRLSIIDVSGGHQPLCNETQDVWTVMNGEIYGYQTLREELERKGHHFATKSDTAVIVHGYEEWGDDCFAHFHGMFAIALWDAKRERLLLARDRLGKKPLYWTVRDGTLWFGSELKALLAAEAVEKNINLTALGLYFRTDSVSTPHTIFQNVFKLEPGSVLAWKNDQQEKTWKFWSCPQTTFEEISLPEAVSELRSRIDQAVRLRLISDVPLGLFLSGGIDSAVIAESASRQSNKRLKAFTIGFEDASHDERSAARQVAKSFDLEHHETLLTSEAALGVLQDAVKLLDEPLADPSILPQLLLSRFTREQVTVALSGDGGDELLLGYPHVRAHEWMNRLGWFPGFLRAGAKALLKNIPARTGYFSLGFKTQRLARGLTLSDPWARDLAWRGSFTAPELETLFLPEIRQATEVNRAEQELQLRAEEIPNSQDFWRAWSWAYLRTYLMDDVLVKVDRATMRYALESRAPLLDTRVVEFLWQLPEKIKLNQHKRLFKELIKSSVPREILERPKHGFTIPVAAWLRGPLAAKLHELTSPQQLRSQGLFESATVERLIKEHAHGRPDRRKELWALLMFQMWYYQWLKK